MNDVACSILGHIDPKKIIHRLISYMNPRTRIREYGRYYLCSRCGERILKPRDERYFGLE